MTIIVTYWINLHRTGGVTYPSSSILIYISINITIHSNVEIKTLSRQYV